MNGKPESETPETDALIERHRTEIPARSPLTQVRELIEHTRSLERRLIEYQNKHIAIMLNADRRYDELATALSLAQTEIKGHMRHEDDLQHDIARHLAICSEQAIRIAELEKYWGDTEARAAEAHAVYQAEAHRRGDVRHPDAYDDLSEATKEWDRVLVRWVAASLKDRA